VGFARAGTVRDAFAITICPQCQEYNLETDECDPIAEGMPCDDGNACTENTTCIGGSCAGGQPVSCDDGNACTIDSCDPRIGCLHTNVADGATCDDGNACTTDDVCYAGSCVAGTTVTCPAPDACHGAGTCNPATGVCSAPPLTAATCKNGWIKGAACDCDGTCCGAGNNCVGRPGQRRCE
jgi:hypothetical protein